jgi:four helix bundle protein
MVEETFHGKLKLKMDEFAHLIYRLTKKFPKEELYGLVSQLRRAAVSIILNYIEGYARNKKLVVINFLEISYGSLKECKYLLNFSVKEKYIEEKEYLKALALAEEIGAMLWKTMKKMREK